MFKHRTLVFLEDPVWIRVSILSYWVPNFLEYTYNNTSTVGLIMAFSSIAGLSVDLIFPQILKQVTVKKLILFAITASFIFSGSLLRAIDICPTTICFGFNTIEIPLGCLGNHRSFQSVCLFFRTDYCR